MAKPKKPKNKLIMPTAKPKAGAGKAKGASKAAPAKKVKTKKKGAPIATKGRDFRNR